MSASFDMVTDVADRLRDIVQHTAATALIYETNKRGVVWCDSYPVAKHLRAQCEREGYQVILRRGLKSQHYYLSAFY